MNRSVQQGASIGVLDGLPAVPAKFPVADWDASQDRPPDVAAHPRLHTTDGCSRLLCGIWYKPGTLVTH